MQTLLQEVVDDPSGNKMLLVMDYMEGGPVMTREALERGRCIPESLACQYFRDMCKVPPPPSPCAASTVVRHGFQAIDVCARACNLLMHDPSALCYRETPFPF